MSINVDVMQDASEIVHYDNPAIPIYLRYGTLSSYPDMRALCHWHEDIELIYIIEGEMNYDINGKKVLLKEGDSIVVNSRQMHFGYSQKHNECYFICILFHPSIFSANHHMYEQYVQPLIENSSIDFIVYDYNHPYREQAGTLQKQILILKEEAHSCFEFNVMSCFFQLWSIIYQSCQDTVSKEPETQLSDLIIQKKMVSYIYQKYNETISLEDIAAAGNVSRSKCCILFKKYLRQSPIDFVNAYRLEVSCHLLTNTAESISNIALSCGFNHLSYFSKLFLRKYGCTPSEFRTAQTE